MGGALGGGLGGLASEWMSMGLGERMGESGDGEAGRCAVGRVAALAGERARGGRVDERTGGWAGEWMGGWACRRGGRMRAREQADPRIHRRG